MNLILLSGRRPDAVLGVCATPVGEALLAFTPEGVLWLSFGAAQSAVEELRAFWKGGSLVRDDAAAQKLADHIFGGEVGGSNSDVKDGADKAGRLARKTLSKVYKKVGFIQ